MERRVTLKDIARAANVSIGTVDRAINDRGRISDETKTLIMSKIEEMKYRPNAIASTLRKQKQHTIALVIPGNNAFFQAIINGAMKACAELDDYRIALQPVLQASEEEPLRQLADFTSIVNSAQAGGAYNGIIVAPLHAKLSPVIDQAADMGMKVVTVNIDAKNSKRICYIGQDPWRTGGIVAAIIGKSMNNTGEVVIMQAAHSRASWRQRTEGFSHVLRNDYPGIHIAGTVPYENDQQAAYTAAMEVLHGKPGIGGIFADTTTGILGAGMAIRDSGRKGRVIAVMYDTPPEGIRLLDDNVFIAAITQNPFFQGYYAAKIMCRILLEQYKPEKEMWYTSADIIVNSRQMVLNEGSVNNIL